MISSLRTGMVLLALIAAFAALSSLLVPGDFSDTVLFKALLLFLLINLTLCTINRFKQYLKAFHRPSAGRVRGAALIILHAGAVLILIGGTVNSFYGQAIQAEIRQGDIFDISGALNAETPLSLRLDEFQIEYYPDGSPSQYYSHVSLLEEGSPAQTAVISVNHPLKHRGIKAYQHSFGCLINVQLSWLSGTQILREGDVLEIPGSDKTVGIIGYIPNFSPGQETASQALRPDNPRIAYSVFSSGSLQGVGAASLMESLEAEPGVFIHFRGIKPYTVLKIKKDPGLPLAAAGGIMLSGGTCLALFLSRRKRFLRSQRDD